jgi:predicted TIM-barrel fold metal-dependent hydrolase
MDQLPNTDLLLELVKQWLSAEQLQRLLVDNPTQLYWG